MWEQLLSHLPTIGIGALVAATALLAVLQIRKDRKNGDTCGCGCKDCAHSALCHKPQATE